MKLILYCWGANNEELLKKNLVLLGHDVTICNIKCKNYTRDMDLASSLIMQIHAENADAVISYNYFPIISLACNTVGIKYYSWVYDCPHFTLYAKTVNLPCNRIGIFDKDMVKTLAERGIDTIFHLPLAVDTDAFINVINNATVEKEMLYSSDVSFVGSLYTDEHNYYDHIFECDNVIKAKANNMLDDICFNYDVKVDTLIDAGSEIYMYANAKCKDLGLLLGDDFVVKDTDIVIPSVFEKKTTILERKRLLQAISNVNNVDFKLYTNSKTDMKTNGVVDYKSEMPLVFANSRINLNLSLRSIHSGIPLRVMDILSCGGFVLTNYQPEIKEYFKDGEELVIFNNLEDCIDKIKYYLEHEEERKIIAKKGKKKVVEQFGYKKMLESLLRS